MMKTFAMRNEARVEERRVETSNSFNDSVESIINWQLAAWLGSFAVTSRCHSRGLKIDSLIRFDWWLTGFNYAKLWNEIIAINLSIFICKCVNCAYLALHEAYFVSIILIPGHHCVGIVVLSLFFCSFTTSPHVRWDSGCTHARLQAPVLYPF